MAIDPHDTAHHGEAARPRESRRDPDVVRTGLQTWLAERVTDPAVGDVHIPESNGMSSETLLFDARWDGTDHRLVARVAPAASAVPVFPHYDLDAQARVMRAVAAATAIPVPHVHWTESDTAVLGAPFLVMSRIDGIVPPDVMPYNFGSWVTEATDGQRATLQDRTVDVLAQIHTVDPATAGLASHRCAGDAIRAHVAAQRAYYEWTTRTGPRSPLIERAFTWLDTHVPDDPAPAVLCWGDARIGNIMFDDFEPAGVLDWELAATGAREMDLAWMIFLHRFFEDIAGLAGFPGLPGFLRRDDVADTYAQRTGHVPQHLDFHTCYAAVQHAIIMLRIATRAVHFGQSVVDSASGRQDDPDAMIMHRTTLESMLDGTYWEALT